MIFLCLIMLFNICLITSQ